MSNVRSFNDYQDDKAKSQQAPPGKRYGFGNPGSNEGSRLRNGDSLDIEGGNNNNSGFGLAPGATARTVVERVFPKFSFLSFTFLVSAFQITVFVSTEIISLFYTDKGTHDQTFTCVLYDFGAKFTPSIVVKHDIHRLVLPIFLHAGVAHILFNLFSQNMYGYVLEDFYGRARFIMLYLLAGVGGNLFSAVTQMENLSVGASSSLFGLFALNIAYIIENYERFGNKKRLILTIMIVIIAVNFLAVPQDEKGKIDVASHIGGFLTGALIAILYMSRPGDRKFMIAKVFAGIALIAFYAICFWLLFTIENLERRQKGIEVQCASKSPSSPN